MADKDCEDKYDLLSNALRSTRDSVSTRGSTSTRESLIRASIPSARGSVSVRGSDVTFGAGIDQQPPEVFRDDGDYSQLNMVSTMDGNLSYSRYEDSDSGYIYREEWLSSHVYSTCYYAASTVSVVCIETKIKQQLML